MDDLAQIAEKLNKLEALAQELERKTPKLAFKTKGDVRRLWALYRFLKKLYSGRSEYGEQPAKNLIAAIQHLNRSMAHALACLTANDPQTTLQERIIVQQELEDSKYFLSLYCGDTSIPIMLTEGEGNRTRIVFISEIAFL